MQFAKKISTIGKNFVFRRNFHEFDSEYGEIFSRLEAGLPSMIARFGSNEIRATLYPNLFLAKPFFKQRIFQPMEQCAGFYPATSANINAFSQIMLDSTKNVGVLGSWRFEEIFLRKELSQARFVPLSSLEPYFSAKPWSAALRDKDVLVVHPFAGLIERQYHEKRELLFRNPEVLPPFRSLRTVQAVQSIAGNPDPRFPSWFDALEWMKGEIDKRPFDIAIIGCGAYGFPLAAHVKRNGGKAVHMGGATQILFGIKGKRWEERENFQSIINEHFVSPSKCERPPGAALVEGGCYW